MGMCSYCYQYSREECFGWGEARGCGITGPDDPVRAKNRKAYYADKLRSLKADQDKMAERHARETQALVNEIVRCQEVIAEPLPAPLMTGREE